MTSAVPMTAAEYWDKYKPHRGEQPHQRPAADRFDWTGVPDDGTPGAELLGRPKTALDLGPAEGENAAHLARVGVEVTAVDFSPVQVERARGFWADLPNLTFVHAEACAYLDRERREFDAVYSTWGAVWFTDPDDLFSRVRRCLRPGGVFGFSHREPASGQYGAQPMSGKWPEGRESELTVYRWQYSAQQWADLLKGHGFTNIAALVLPRPDPAALGTLLVTAQAPRPARSGTRLTRMGSGATDVLAGLDRVRAGPLLPRWASPTRVQWQPQSTSRTPRGTSRAWKRAARSGWPTATTSAVSLSPVVDARPALPACPGRLRDGQRQRHLSRGSPYCGSPPCH